MGSKKDDIPPVEEAIDGILAKIIDDVGKTSAIRQLMIGAVSGWLTGYTLMKVGKATAAAIGSGIMILEVANHAGYIDINWDKLTKKAEKISEKIEDSGTKPNLMKKVGRFVDKKLDKAEDLLKKKEIKAKKWFSKFSSEEEFYFEEIHVFFMSFLAGMSLGMAVGIAANILL